MAHARWKEEVMEKKRATRVRERENREGAL
jgi:hypothetical protein